MVFNSDIFLFVFLPVVFILFWVLRAKRSRYILLTVSSYIFYGYWNWNFCFLLLLSSLVSFFAAILIDNSQTRAARRLCVLGSISVDLALLGFFKYYNFLVGSAWSLAGQSAPPLLDIVLPVGISFYTFHTISYILDVHDRRVTATRDVFEYFTYVSLFSQLVAGPIVRFRQIEQDLEHIDHSPRQDQLARGIGVFVTGLVKKCVVADSIAKLVDPLLLSYTSLSMASAWLAALGYTFQLYYDFSGYSDMAIGLGHMFGIRIPQNFNAPYQALGIRDFWRRWHMSLSSWLRDYLYIRLGGNRQGPVRTNINLFVTMLLGGLWHGASWTFVGWGAYHGLLLIGDRMLDRMVDRVPVVVRRGVTFVLVVVGWVLFRSTSFTMARTWLATMVGLGGTGGAAVPFELFLWSAACLAAVNVLPETWDIRYGVRTRWAGAYAALFVIAYLFMNGQQTVFLYYQF